MKFEELVRSYDGLKDLLALATEKFGKTFGKTWIAILSLCFFVLNLFKVNLLLKYFLDKKLNKLVTTHAKVGFVYSKNQNKILLKLRSLGFIFPVYYFTINQCSLEDDIYIPEGLILISFIVNPNSTLLIRKAAKHPILNYDLVRVSKTIGLHYIYNKLLSNKKEVINFNDHTPYNVLLYNMANNFKIKTLYIQHAPVSERFPPLYHDINILFSQDSLDKYRQYSDDVSVVLACDIRFLLNKNSVDSNNEDKILICPNELDSFDIIDEFIQKLSNIYPILLRPHPNDPRNWGNIKNCILSNNVSLWDDMEYCNIVITNESAVSLEAIFFDKKLYKAAFFSESYDDYSFIKKGLIVREYEDMDAIIDAIKENRIDYNKDKLEYFIGSQKGIVNKLEGALGKTQIVEKI